MPVTQRNKTSAAPANARFFILTIPHECYTPWLPPNSAIIWVRGQLELAESGFLHWQLVVGFNKSVRFAHVKSWFGDSAHVEATRSAAADEYVWKDETSVAGTRFELGKKPFVRNTVTDWDRIRELAVAGTLEEVPSDIFVRLAYY